MWLYEEHLILSRTGRNQLRAIDSLMWLQHQSWIHEVNSLMHTAEMTFEPEKVPKIKKLKEKHDVQDQRNSLVYLIQVIKRLWRRCRNLRAKWQWSHLEFCIICPMINSDTLNAQSGSFDRLPTNAGKGSDSFASTGNRMMQNVVLTKQVIEFALPLENSKIESLLATAKSVWCIKAEDSQSSDEENSKFGGSLTENATELRTKSIDLNKENHSGLSKLDTILCQFIK